MGSGSPPASKALERTGWSEKAETDGLLTGRITARLVMYGWVFGYSSAHDPDPAERHWARRELAWWVPRARQALEAWSPSNEPECRLPQSRRCPVAGLLWPRSRHAVTGSARYRKGRRAGAQIETTAPRRKGAGFRARFAGGA